MAPERSGGGGADIPEPGSHASPAARLLTACMVALVFALASMFGTNPYQYGVGDNSITIPFVKAFANPRLYPGDFMLAQRPFYYTYLWNTMGWILLHLRASLPWLFLSVYFAGLVGTFLAVYVLAMRLFDRVGVALLALLFLLFTRSTLAGIDTIELTLNARHVAVPMCLFALVLFLERKTVRAFALMGLSYLVHPLTTHYGLAVLLVASIVELPRRGVRPLLLGLGAFLLIACPLITWKLMHTPPTLHLLAADARWVQALRMRSSHHMFPFTWGWPKLVHVVLVLVLISLGWRTRPRDNPEDHRIIATLFWTVVSLCVAGVVFTEWMPLGAAFLLQPLRSFELLEYTAMLYVANRVHRGFLQSRQPAGILAAVPVGLAVYVGVESSSLPGILFLAVVAVMATGRFLRRVRLTEAHRVIAVCGLVILTGGGLYRRDAIEADRDGFSFSNAQDVRWLDIQRWARVHTDVRDAFIVPPEQYDEFRIEGERTVYADWDDGGLMNSNPAYGLEWLRRMQMLGFPRHPTRRSEFRPLTATDCLRIAAELNGDGRRVFLARPLSLGSLGFPIRYRNAHYMIAEIRGHQTPPRFHVPDPAERRLPRLRHWA